MDKVNQPKTVKNTIPLLYPYIPKRMEKQLKYQVFKDKSTETISQWNIFCSHQKETIVLNGELKNIGRELFLNGLYRFIYTQLNKFKYLKK